MIIVATPRAALMRRHLARRNDTSEDKLLRSPGGSAAAQNARDRCALAMRMTVASGAEGDAQEPRRTIRQPREHSAMSSYGTRYYC